MSLTMINDVKIPIIGLGTWQSTDEEELEKALDAALEIGYRHIDTATVYKNEHIIGKVLNKWFTSGKLKREDLFITTKLPLTHVHPDEVESQLKQSLEKLQMDYVDLYLIHFPIYIKYVKPGSTQEFTSEPDFNSEPEFIPEPQPTDHLAVWKKMEEQVDAGRARTIGISNFGIHQIDKIVKNSRIKPANTQVELHIYNQQKELREYCKKHNIVVVSYSSLGSPGATEVFKNREPLPNILGDPLVAEIAKKHKRTPVQVILRYLTQNDIVVIPKSVKPDRLRENFNILNFKLDSQDLKALEALDKGEDGRIFRMDFFGSKVTEHPEFPFNRKI